MTDLLPDGWAPEDVEHLSACPVCGSEASGVIYTGLNDCMDRSARGGWTLRGCEGCGSGYINPRPTRATVGRLYAHGDYYTHTPPPLDAVGGSRLNRIRWSLFHGYLNHRYGYLLAPSSPVGRLVVRLIPGARGIAAQHVRALGRPEAGARLLDIGCANGSFLLRMKGLGWSVTGIEVDPAAAGHARDAGLDVHQCSIEDHPLAPASFDAITFSHVLEHLHDPVGAIRACATLLRPGGTLWVGVPNLDGAGRRFMTKDWAPLDPPRHLVMFTGAGLASVLSAAGFVDIRDEPTVLDAGAWAISASVDMAGGGNGLGRPRLSARLRAVALRCDLRAIRNPAVRENFNITARRGTAGPTDGPAP